MLHRPALLGVSLALALGWPRAARSDTPTYRLGADALAEEGAKLMARGEYEKGCSKYEESARLDQSPARLLTLASCHERRGKVATAWATLSEAAELAEARGEPKKAALARESQKRLAPHIGRLKVIVPDEAKVDDLVITRDGAPLSCSLWGLPVAIDPGPHVIRVTAPGRQGWQVEVGLMPGPSTMLLRVPVLAVDPERVKADQERVLLDRRGGAMSTPDPFVTAAHVPQPAVDTTPADAPGKSPTTLGSPRRGTGDDPGRTQRTLGLVLAGTGVTALALGAAFSFAARSTRDDLDATCAGKVCPPSSMVLWDEAQAEAVRANVSLGIGLIALAGGAVVYFSAPSSRGAETGRQNGAGAHSRLRLTPTLGPSEAALVAAGQF
jgi:hypothetical protein